MQPTPDSSIITTISDLDSDSNSYLSYAPTASSTSQSFKHFFEKLGFRSEDQTNTIRDTFIANMDHHVQHRSHRFLLRAKNPQAYKVIVSEFLAEYGSVYWGSSERDHLEEPNPLKGFLCPRDATRAKSRLIDVLESFFNCRAYAARAADKARPRARRLNRGTNFEALTGRKADLSAARKPHRGARRRVRSESTGDNSALPMGLMSHQSALSSPQPLNPIASPEPDHPQNPTSNHNSPPKASRSCRNAIIIMDESDTGEEMPRKNTTTHASTNMIAAPRPSTQDQYTRIKAEALSPEITSRIEFRVRADGPGVSARGPIPVDFEFYKTSERLFTALMSERSLKPEVQKRVSQLTATVMGKDMCCRRDRWDDWAKVCRELRELWDRSPEVFDRRFEVDVMLHVDE